MFETKMICDRCGREEKVKSTYTYPQKWVSLSIKYKDGKYKCEQIKEYHLCEECANNLEVVPTPNNTEVYEKDVADRLLEILEEIVGNFHVGNNSD